MGLLDKIFGAPATAAKGAAGAVVDVANGVSDIVERWAPSADKKHEMYLEINKAVQDAAASARTYNPVSTGTSRFSEITNVLVDAASRMIRPLVTVLLIGAVFGWWPVATRTVDPIVLSWGEAVMAFWFGARTVFKDIPELLKSIKDLRK